MTIDDTLLAKLEKLSMLHIEDEHRQEVKEHLASIVSFVENLNELDDKLSSISVAVAKKPLHLREDAPQCDPLIHEHILSHAPKAQEGFFVVPKIIE